jgi:hypothetical protein
MEGQYGSQFKERFNALSEYSREFQSQRSVIFGQKFTLLNDPARAILAFEKALGYDANNMLARTELCRALASNVRVLQVLDRICRSRSILPTPQNCLELTRTILEQAPEAVAAASQTFALPNKPTVTMSLLGNDGRFGNQVYQYAFLRLYTGYHELSYQVPSWIGQTLFGHNDPPLSNILPLRMCTEGGLVPFQQPMGFDCLEPPRNIDLQGYFQHHTSVYEPFKAQFRSLFRPVPQVFSVLHEWLRECRRGSDTLIVAHFRFGDQSGTEYESRPEVCAQWLLESWSQWVRPRLIVISDDVQRAKASFQALRPYGTPAVSLPIVGAEFYPEYFLMTQADVLLVSRSTFSFTASLLNEVSNSLFRPTEGRTGVVRFDPWNALN